MPFVPVQDAAELVIHGTVGSKDVANVIGFQHLGAYTPSDLQDLATAADGVVTSGYKPLMTAGMTYNSCVVRGLTSSIDFAASDSSGAGTGGVSGAQLNNNVTLCITLRSANTGRSARGRFYAFPTGASQLSAANTFSTTYAGDLIIFLESLQAAAAIAGWTMVVISRFHNLAPRTSGVTFPITSIEARNLISDSQRGRLPKGH